MKNILLTSILLILINISRGQTSSPDAEKNKTLLKWTNAVINLECVSFPSSDSIFKIDDALKKHLIDTFTAKKRADHLQNNPKTWGGTAIFLKYHGQLFLLSARHVFAGEGSDSMYICQSIVLVEDSARPKNDLSGHIIIDTPMRGDYKNIGNTGIGLSIAPGTILPNFEYLDSSAERTSLKNLQNSPDSTVYYFSSIADDIGLINLDNIGKEGKLFIKTLYNRGYKPISAGDIDTLCHFKKLDPLICIGYPIETQFDLRSVSWFRNLSVAHFKSLPMVTSGYVEKNVPSWHFFEADLFTYHGFSGGPIIKDNKLIGLVSAFSKPERKIKADTTSNLFLEYHSRFMKASLIYNCVKKFYSQVIREKEGLAQYDSFLNCNNQMARLPINGKRALYWLKRSAENGNSNSEDILGTYYLFDSTLSNRDSFATYWISKAALQRNGSAENDLGACYGNGIYFKKNDTTAAEWFYQSMNDGCIGGMGNYGIMLYEGRGNTKQDQVLGLSYIRQAADGNIPEFTNYLKKIGAK